jgi:hypothetical protein
MFALYAACEVICYACQTAQSWCLLSGRATILPGQDGGPGTLVKPLRDHSPAVAMPHQVYTYAGIDTSSHYAIPAAAAANYEAVLRTLNLKQVTLVSSLYIWFT